MIRVIDETRRESPPTEGKVRSLDFLDGIRLIEALPDSKRVRVYPEIDEEARAYWDSRRVCTPPAELTPEDAIDLIKTLILRDGNYAISADYQVTNFDANGKRETWHKVLFERHEIYGIIGKGVTLDPGPVKSNTVVFYEQNNLPGIKNWLARKLSHVIEI